MPLGLTRIGLSTAPRTHYFWEAVTSGSVSVNENLTLKITGKFQIPLFL